MGKLIDDLLSFSRLGRKKLQKTVVDMNILTDDVLAEIEKNMSHSAEIEVGDLHKMHGDYSLLYQVVYNFISNAVKYSSKKDKPVIKISSTQKKNRIVYSVKDNGVGFDSRYVDKLFNVFQRLHSDYEFEGTGVGLAIVKRIINKHKGKVWAEGEIDKGATFYFSFPKTKILTT